MIYNKDLETLSVEKLRSLQSDRLIKVLQKVYHKVPMYKSKFDQAGINLTNIRSIKDISQLPFTHKSDLRDNYPFGLFTQSRHSLARLHCSSGTTGKPTVVGYTSSDLSVFSEVIARSLCAGGALPDMTLHNAYGYGIFTGGLGLHYGAERLGMTVLPISGGGTDRQIRLLKDFQSEVISSTPSYALTIAERLKEKGMTVDDINLKYAILGAEPWTEAIRLEVEEKLNVKASNIYGLSEIIGPGVAQEDINEQGTGSYIWEDHFFPEVVDKDTAEPLPYGEEGVLVFTTLTKEGMPLIRYWTNDICSIYYDHSYKRTHIKMSPIKGRADEMLIIRGVNLFHTQVEEIIKDIEYLLPNYKLVVKRKGRQDSVCVHVEVKSSYIGGEEIKMDMPHIKKAKHVFSQKIKENIGLSMDVLLYKEGGLPKEEGGKTKRVYDERNA